ncbi:MAG: hypothetical protein MPEBLZ_04158 [Candidatus Methanoperedens nitroreducens]|uniref:Uncharacterized protein n=1 Tax=Candidatus Methanoperedens nitratireducens TaxID=1392998 RepID=A0A0P7ZA59_9EURY|nr:MAG: hypothetical protein MPEBLZ_04158 [Candidatus Methanoperedens sp. BLZ1]
MLFLSAVNADMENPIQWEPLIEELAALPENVNIASLVIEYDGNFLDNAPPKYQGKGYFIQNGVFLL